MDTDAIPNIVILVLYLLTGCIGNIIVLYIYRYKMRNTLDNRIFIPCLALADFVSSLLCSSFAIYALLISESYTNIVTCKLSWYSMTWSTIVAMIILTLIAFERYMKICHPLSRSFLNGREVQAVVSLYVSALVIDAPILFMAEITTVTTRDNKTEHICDRVGETFQTGTNHRLAIAYTVLEMISMPIIFIVILFLYCKISCVLYQRMKFKSKKMNTMSGNTNCEMTSVTQMETTGPIESEKTMTSTNISGKDIISSRNKTVSSTIAYKNDDNNISIVSSGTEICQGRGVVEIEQCAHGSMNNEKARKEYKQILENKNRLGQGKIHPEYRLDCDKKHNRKQETIHAEESESNKHNKAKPVRWFFKQHRYTLIFIIISIIYFISFTPRAILIVMETVNTNFWNEFRGNSVYQLLIFLNRLHIVNGVVNPILYGIFDEKFKTHFMKLFKCSK